MERYTHNSNLSTILAPQGHDARVYRDLEKLFGDAWCQLCSYTAGEVGRLAGPWQEEDRDREKLTKNGLGAQGTTAAQSIARKFRRLALFPAPILTVFAEGLSDTENDRRFLTLEEL